MSAASALQQFRLQLIYFLANPSVCYEDIEGGGYCFTVSKRTDNLMSNLLGLPPTPYVLLSSLNIRTWGSRRRGLSDFLRSMQAQIQNLRSVFTQDYGS